MKITRLQFSIDIRAEKARIWETLWSDKTYRDWISIFSEGAYCTADHWRKGGKVLFLSHNQDGIFSIIKEHISNEIIQFEHIGTVVNGQEQPMDDETKKWSGTTEIYKLQEGTDHNILTIEIDILDEHLEFMKDKLPKALKRIKQLSEKA